MNYGVVYDAGSVHTTVAVYEWSRQKLNGTGVVREVLTCEIPIERGISSFRGRVSTCVMTFDLTCDSVPASSCQHKGMHALS
jgi:hypothetical protein